MQTILASTAPASSRETALAVQLVESLVILRTDLKPNHDAILLARCALEWDGGAGGDPARRAALLAAHRNLFATRK